MEVLQSGKSTDASQSSFVSVYSVFFPLIVFPQLLDKAPVLQVLQLHAHERKLKT